MNDYHENNASSRKCPLTYARFAENNVKYRIFRDKTYNRIVQKTI